MRLFLSLMISLLQSASCIYRWFRPGILASKLEQHLSPSTRSLPALEGSVATCTVDASGTLTKSLRPEARRCISEMQRHLSIFAALGPVVVGFLPLLQLEVDLLHEARMLEHFHASWGSPTVPRLRGSSEQMLSMEYVPWPQLHEVMYSETKAALAAIELAGDFFFKSAQDLRLLHGDMSRFNILVRINDGPVAICVVDYGLSMCICSDDAAALARLEKDAPGELAGHLVQAWQDPEDNYAFSSAWRTELESKFNFGDRSYVANAPSCLVLFLRSLLALTMLRCEARALLEGHMITDVHQ